MTSLTKEVVFNYSPLAALVFSGLTIKDASVATCVCKSWQAAGNRYLKEVDSDLLNRIKFEILPKLNQQIDSISGKHCEMVRALRILDASFANFTISSQVIYAVSWIFNKHELYMSVNPYYIEKRKLAKAIQEFQWRQSQRLHEIDGLKAARFELNCLMKATKTTMKPADFGAKLDICAPQIDAFME